MAASLHEQVGANLSIANKSFASAPSSSILAATEAARCLIHSNQLSNPQEHLYVNLSTFWFRLLALVTAVGLLVSLISNMIIIYLFASTPSIRKNPSNIIAVNLSLSDLLYCTQWPLIIYCSLTESTWILEYKSVCQGFGFITVCTAAASILTVLALTIERAVVIKHSIRAKKYFNCRTAGFIIVFIWFAALTSALPPLFGKFNRYTLDPSKTSCTIDYLSAQENYKLYNLIHYVAYWILPTLIISISYAMILATFKKSSLSLKMSARSKQSDDGAILSRANTNNELLQHQRHSRSSLRDSLRLHQLFGSFTQKCSNASEFFTYRRSEKRRFSVGGVSLYKIEVSNHGNCRSGFKRPRLNSLSYKGDCNCEAEQTKTEAVLCGGFVSRDVESGDVSCSSRFDDGLSTSFKNSPSEKSCSESTKRCFSSRNLMKRLDCLIRGSRGAQTDSVGAEAHLQAVASMNRSITLDVLRAASGARADDHRTGRSKQDGRCCYYMTRDFNSVARAPTVASCTSRKNPQPIRLPFMLQHGSSHRSKAANSHCTRAILQFRLAKMSFYLILLWLVSWTPIASLVMLNSVLECHRFSATAVFLAITMTKLGPAFDVFIYGISHPKLKRKFTHIIKRMFMISQIRECASCSPRE